MRPQGCSVMVCAFRSNLELFYFSSLAGLATEAFLSPTAGDRPKTAHQQGGELDDGAALQLNVQRVADVDASVLRQIGLRVQMCDLRRSFQTLRRLQQHTPCRGRSGQNAPAAVSTARHYKLMLDCLPSSLTHRADAGYQLQAGHRRLSSPRVSVTMTRVECMNVARAASGSMSAA